MLVSSRDAECYWLLLSWNIVRWNDPCQSSLWRRTSRPAGPVTYTSPDIMPTILSASMDAILLEPQLVASLLSPPVGARERKGGRICESRPHAFTFSGNQTSIGLAVHHCEPGHLGLLRASISTSQHISPHYSGETRRNSTPNRMLSTEEILVVAYGTIAAAFAILAIVQAAIYHARMQRSSPFYNVSRLVAFL